MSDSSNPFTEKVAKAKEAKDGSRKGWIVAGVLGAIIIILCVLFASVLSRLREQESLAAKLEDTTASLKKALAENEQAKQQLAALQGKVSDLEKEKLTVNILDRIMFDSGESILKPDGESVLKKVASFLAGHPELKIHVIGHTDNIPIRSRYASNWELSTARALAALHFLTEKAGVDPLRVGVVGYGEYRPIADNATAEGRARNRRIAITILPDELAGADAIPSSAPAPANLTNSSQPVIPSPTPSGEVAPK